MSEREEESGAGRGGWPFSGRQTVAALVVVVAGIFVLQNTDDVDIEFFTVTLSAPLWLVLGALFVIGMLVGILLQRRRAKG